MAFMTNLRDKTHLILFTLLAAFLALVVFKWGMDFTGRSGQSKVNVAGRVNGKDIAVNQYDDIYKELSENFRRANPSADMTPEVEVAMQERAWNVVVDQALLEQLFEKFRITLQDQEVVDALQSPFPPRVIRQNFTDPSTGAIDRKKLEAARRDPAAKDIWVQLEKIVRNELKISKLIRALQSVDQVTSRDLDDIVRRQYQRFSASFIPVPLDFAGPDSSFPVKEEEIKNYYEAHKALFKQPPTRSADFVFLPLVPSSKDSVAMRSDIEAIRAEFAGTKSDSEYVRLQSDRSGGINVTYNRADFSPAAGDMVFNSQNLNPGTVIGPVADNGTYRLLKVRQLAVSAQPAARASHILLKFNPSSSSDVQRVRGLLTLLSQQLRSGVPFEQLAQKYSADTGSASRGGDLGWFTKERMVPAFAAAVFNARPGAIVGPVQTQFGLHIIKVTGFDQKAVVCSEVVRIIRPSTETTDGQRRIAMAFQMSAKSRGLDKAAAAQKFDLLKTGDFAKHMALPGIGYSEKIASFAFKAKEGELSDVIETEKGFYIMRLTGSNDTGYRQLDKDIKARITAELMKEKKGAALEKKLASMAKAPGATLEKIAASNPSFRILTAGDIRWSDGAIPGFGTDRQLVEAMSGLDIGKLSSPVNINGGRALVVLRGKSYPEGIDLKAEAAKIAPQLLKLKQQQNMEEYFETVKKNAKIEDFRP
ncbi:MAG: peptidylprolyl isomerase [Chlorobiaceae bacterium]|nr:peptidylprolyl isomerase [Chlorobiaceae bacterium]NTV60776.1 peptidylprolyl isomerase [Chlorobiaceae bacterium]